MPNKSQLHPNYLCREVPGHSGCEKKINNCDCPSKEGAIDSSSCHGHSHNPSANLQQAMQWLHELMHPQQTQSASFVSER